MKKRILSCLLSIAMCLTLLPLGIQAQAAYFGDVTSHWARSYIEDAVDMGLFNGTAPNRFEPESAMTRAMFVTVLYRMDGGEAERSANFIDVPRGSWYSDAVAWASENSIVTGTSAIRFSPNDSVTREQMVTILNRYLTASGAALGSDGEAPAISFRDSSSIAPYAREAVEKMQRASIVSGKPSGFGYRFDPQGCATRAEVACIMCKFLDQLSYDEVWEPDINDASECIDYAESSFDDVEMEYTDEDGLVAYADVPKVLADCETAAKKMKEQGIISKYNVNDDNITVWFTSGGAYMYTLNIKEMQEYAASPGVMVYEQRRGMSSDPERDKCFENKQKKYGYVTDLAKKIAQKDSGYPYVADYGGTNLTVDSAKEWNSNSIIIWVGHGDYDEDIGPCLITSQVRTDDNFQRFANDFKAGRIIGQRGDYYALTWKFFDYYYKNNSLKGSLIWLAPCYSIRDSRLADTLLAKGASTVIGNKNPAYIPRIIYLTNEFFNTLMSTDLDTGATYTAGKALAKANDKLKANKVGDLVAPVVAVIGENTPGSVNEVILKGDANWSLGGGATVTGMVGDENGHPIKGAVVSIEGTNHTAVTASDGSYTLYGAGSMQTVPIKAEADGYYSETTSVSIGSTKGHASFVLKSIGKIKLAITADQDEDEISSVNCDVYKISGNKETLVKTKSFSTRSFTIDSLENGQEYKVKVVARNYEWAYATTTAERSPTEIQVKLVKRNINLMPDTTDKPTTTPDTSTSTDLPAADSDGWTRVYNGEQLTKALEANRNIKLMADVKDVEGVQTYSGTLDGNGHTVTNPKFASHRWGNDCTEGWIVALQSGATIKNLNFAEVNYSRVPGHLTAGITGVVTGSCSIEKCIIRSGTLKVQTYHPLYIGAFVGRIVTDEEVNITDCVNMADITVTATICQSNSYSEANISAGGIVGYVSSKDPITIQHCLNTGNISAIWPDDLGYDPMVRVAGICYFTVVNQCGNTGQIRPNSQYSLTYEDASTGYTIAKTTGDVLLSKYYPLYTYSERDILSMWSDVLN